MRARVSAMLAGAVVAGGLTVSGAAYADAWYSQTLPLFAYEDGVKQAGFGNSYIQDGSYARVNSWQKDYRAGGNDVYIDTDYKYWMPNSINEMAWVEKASKETDRTDSGTWVYDYTRHTLLGDPDRVRMVSHVCEDQSWHSDPCSVNVIKTLSY